MNLGQTMITMGMFVLLVMSVISANRMLVDNNESTLKVESYTASASIANDIMAEAQGKKFDKFADTTGTQQPADFSSPTDTTGSHAGWGPSAAERAAVGPMPDSSYTGNYRSITAFDDFDDYDGYSRIVTENNISGFIAAVKVFYVEPSDPDTKVDYRTFFKKIEVYVEHPKYLDKMKYSSLMSY
jgi:hypothetical protein